VLVCAGNRFGTRSENGGDRLTLGVQVLGPVTVVVRGQERALQWNVQEALFACLVMARGRPLPAQLLIDQLWGDLPPRDPAHALQARVSRLRSALKTRIEHTYGGYRLDPDILRTDADRFVELVAEADRLLASDRVERAADPLHEALGLWRGPAFGGLPHICVLRAEAIRLEQLRTATLIDRIDVDLVLGRHAELVPELHALVAEHPLIERHWAQLMLALYAQDRPLEALAIFNRASEVFSQLLGVGIDAVESASELAALRTAIVQQQPAASLLRWR